MSIIMTIIDVRFTFTSNVTKIRIFAFEHELDYKLAATKIIFEKDVIVFLVNYFMLWAYTV